MIFLYPRSSVTDAIATASGDDCIRIFQQVTMTMVMIATAMMIKLNPDSLGLRNIMVVSSATLVIYFAGF